MKKNTPILHCVFSESSQTLPQLLEESFRLYLRCILADEIDRNINCL